MEKALRNNVHSYCTSAINLSSCLNDTKKYDEAIALLKDSLKLILSIPGLAKQNARDRMDLLISI